MRDGLFAGRPITRSEFLRTALAVGLSSSPRFAFFERLAAQTPTPRTQRLASSRWSDASRQQLKTLQEKAYVSLGKQLGLGSDPEIVYSSLSAGRIPAERLTLKRFAETFGSAFGSADNSADGGAADAFRRYNERYRNADLPTPYEEPNLYAVLLEMADAVEQAAMSANLPVPGHLLFGSLPTGSINAKAVSVAPKEYIVLFHYGLFMFAFQMARLAANAFPPLVPDGASARFETRSDPLAVLKRRPEIQDQFNRILYAYVVLGNPWRTPVISVDAPLLPTAMVLLRSMELFCMGHEYTHVIWRHPERGAEFAQTEQQWIRWSWKAEYAADEVGLSLTHSAMSMDLHYSFWGADYFFSCSDIVERCLDVLRVGAVKPAMPQSEHPPTSQRRKKIREVLRDVRPGPDAETAIELGARLQAFIDALWEQSVPRWVALHKSNVRPSPIWS